MKILVVGAGFAGAVHARELAEAGHSVTVIDKRHHIGGNAYDKVDKNGIRVHEYGPHLFHTNNKNVVSWIRRFGKFTQYTHKVRAKLQSRNFVPLPINLDTVNAVFKKNFLTEIEVKNHLKAIAIPISDPQNAAEYLYSTIGRDLTDLFFRPYTKKMWALDLEEMDASVVRRLPLKYDRTDGYFPNDDIQFLPNDGYESVFACIFKHPNIKVYLNTNFEKDMVRDFDFCFNSMPIDAYFEYSEGELPYRSIRFFHRTEMSVDSQGWSVTNFTDNGRFTRETRWDCLPNHVVKETGRISITSEEPCDYRDNNMERYYPVKTSDRRYHRVYKKYVDLALESKNKIKFIGRCGTYQYLDMDQVINQSIISARKFIETTS